MDPLDDGYAMALAGALVWTPRSLRSFLDSLGTARSVIEWVARHDVPPEGVPALSDQARQRVSAIDDRTARAAIDELEKSGARLVRDSDADYPSSLRDLVDPPPLLYVKGDIASLGARPIAIVGSRAATTYGRHVAASLATDLAGFGASIVSGLARGVDACAHAAAVAANAPTIAVIGSGLSALYPPYHALLADEIVAGGGAVISEFPPREAARAHHFPMRNRIVAALAAATIVVEAGLRSGALITARLADEPRVLESSSSPLAALELLRSSATHRRYDDIVVLDADGRYTGVVCIGDVIQGVTEMNIELSATLHPLTRPSRGERVDTMMADASSFADQLAG